MKRTPEESRSVLKTLLLVILSISGIMFSCVPMIPEKDRRAEPPPAETPAETGARPELDLEFVNPELTANTDIHYTGKYCSECHEQEPVEGGKLYLKQGGDYDWLCRCHTYSSADHIHPVDIEPTDEKKERMPEEFPLEGGKLTCLTCHDIYLQCQEQIFETNSLRGAPYSRRTDFCYRCHLRESYEKLNPHKQLNEDGEIIIDTCLICHTEKPDEAHATFKDVKFYGEIEAMCRRCHQISPKHSGNADHMGVKPSPEGVRRLRAVEEEHNVRLPLDEDGRMTCITCHNPHDRGVIPADRPGAKGADSKYRHRLAKNLCKECHQM